MYFETHAHYDDSAFDEDRSEIIQQVFSTGVDYIIDPGCDRKSTQAAMKLSEQYSGYYFAAGIHPEELETMTDTDLDFIRSCTGHPKCVAVGEIGLDYYWKSDNKAAQIDIFRKQLELALACDKPVIIHDREAHGDSLEVIEQYEKLRGVFHCFSGSKEMAEILLKRGWYLGFDGPVTYKNARKTIEVLEICPMDRILIETDSPYMSPVPVRGTRNNSMNLAYICARIAEIKGTAPEDIAAVTTENAKRLFLR